MAAISAGRHRDVPELEQQRNLAQEALVHLAG